VQKTIIILPNGKVGKAYMQSQTKMAKKGKAGSDAADAATSTQYGKSIRVELRRESGLTRR
jgi:hypothetical protein